MLRAEDHCDVRAASFESAAPNQITRAHGGRDQFGLDQLFIPGRKTFRIDRGAEGRERVIQHRRRVRIRVDRYPGRRRQQPLDQFQQRGAVLRVMHPGVDLAVCGEMGGRTLEAMALIGLGIERLSITPAAVGPIKAMIRSLDRGALMERMAGLLAAPPRDLRGALARWAAETGVELA